MVNRTYRYRVSQTLIVGPDDVYVLDPTGQPTLTLVTCYPFNFVGHTPKRFIVRATLETVRQERERVREAGETARAAGEHARAAAEAARHAAMDAVHATTETLQATLEQMKVVEQMRRTLRDIREVNTLVSN